VIVSRTWMFVIFAVALIICAYDIYAAIRGQGHNIVAWVLGVMMAAVAVWVLTKILRGDTSL
jgi:drug/metabolite transporter superfamily protein YnfA